MTAFATDPESACYAVWIVWAISWFLAAVWSSRTQSRASIAQQLPYRLLTLGGFFLLFSARRSQGPDGLWSLPETAGWFMVLLCLVGFAFAWWARIHLGHLWSAFVTRKADHRIVDTGPYGIVRHPIYTGIILASRARSSRSRVRFSPPSAFGSRRASKKPSCANSSAPKPTTPTVAAFPCSCPLRLSEGVTNLPG
jgi:protein-S-isoprenylcysteine O-methyltransferase Ste14